MKPFLALVLAAGCGMVPALARAQASVSSFSFVVTADMREFGGSDPRYQGARYFQGALEAVKAAGPGAFMVSPGDIDPPDQVRESVASVLGRGYAWYPVVGNHETESAAAMDWLRRYNPYGRALPGIVRSGPAGARETCYSFDYGNAHFAVVNQYYDGERDDVRPGDTGDALYDWLQADLKATSKPNIFVLGHEPLLGAPDMDNGRVRHQGDGLDRDAAHARRFLELLRRHRVKAYICGHTHNTSLLYLNGVWQLDGGHCRGIGDKGAASTFIIVRVAGDAVTADIYRDDGQGGPYALKHRLSLTDPLDAVQGLRP